MTIYKKLALSNVTHYKDFEDFSHFEHYNREEFEDEKENGFIQNITLGTYNGATDTFTNREITDGHILDAIETEINESEFENMLFDVDYKQNELPELFTEFYNVVVIENEIYIINN